MWIIEGLADGRVAVMAKMHHATVDGMSGMSLLAHLCSLEPEAPAPAPLDADALAHAPGDLGLLARGVVSNLRKPLHLAKLVPPTVAALRRHDRPGPRGGRDGRTRSPLRGPRSTARSPGDARSPSRTSISIGSRRSRT